MIVSLEIAGDIGEHALHNVETLHVDHDLLDGFLSRLLLRQFRTLVLLFLRLRIFVVADLGSS